MVERPDLCTEFPLSLHLVKPTSLEFQYAKALLFRVEDIKLCLLKHPEQFKGNNKGKLDNTRIFTYLHTLELNPRNKLPCNMGLYSMPKCMTLSSGSYVVLKVYKKEYNKTSSSLKEIQVVWKEDLSHVSSA